MAPEEFGLRDKCAVVGLGATDITKNSGRSDLTLAAQAALAAIEDAGLTPTDIDGVVRCDMDTVLPYALADVLGLTNLTYWSDVPRGGSAAAAMVGQAAAAVIAGLAKNVLVFRELNGRSGRRFGQSLTTAAEAGGAGTYEEFFAPYGFVTAGQQFALMAQRHMIEFGTTSQQLGAVALACRARANANPSALMHDKKLTMQDYMASRMISSPLRLFDFCLETDNAGAVVVTSTERARDLPRPPALIRAVAQGCMPHPQPADFGAILRESLTLLPAHWAAKTLYDRAGMGPEDIDVAQLYDCYTITVVMQLEDYGFCKKGEGGAFVESGGIGLEGDIPVNTDGGNLSYGYIHGINHVIEGVRQIRGDSTSQVDGAETCLVASTPYAPGGGLILRAAS